MVLDREMGFMIHCNVILWRYKYKYTQKRFCNISCIGGCLVAQNTVAEIWSNVW